MVNRMPAWVTDSTSGIVLKWSPADETLRRVDVDDPSMFQDRYPVAQPLGLFHQMGCQKDRFAALANGAYQIPHCVPRLWVEAGGQLVEKHHFRIVDQRESNKQSLLLASGEIHEAGTAFVGEAKLFQQSFSIDGFLPIERRPEIDRLPHFDSLLRLCLLKLDSDAILQFVHLAKRVKTEHGDSATIGL